MSKPRIIRCPELKDESPKDKPRTKVSVVAQGWGLADKRGRVVKSGFVSYWEAKCHAAR